MSRSGWFIAGLTCIEPSFNPVPNSSLHLKVGIQPNVTDSVLCYFVCKQINHEVYTETSRQWTFFRKLEEYLDKICEYDEHPIAGRDIQYRAPDSWSRYTTPFNEIIK